MFNIKNFGKNSLNLVTNNYKFKYTLEVINEHKEIPSMHECFYE
jgi:hypothetical protein